MTPATSTQPIKMVQRKRRERKRRELTRTASATSLDQLLAHCGEDDTPTTVDTNQRQSVYATTAAPPAAIPEMTATPPPNNNTPCTCKCANHHGTAAAADANPEDPNSDDCFDPCSAKDCEAACDEDNDDACCLPNCLQITIPLIIVGSTLAGLLCLFFATESMIRHPLAWVYAWSGMVVGFGGCVMMAVQLEDVPKDLGKPATRNKKKEKLGLTLLAWIAMTWAFIVLFKIVAMNLG